MKLHIGSGNKSLAGWTNFDARAEVNPDIVGDAATLNTLPDNTCEIIYASHILEHFKHARIVPILKNWARRLKSGGKMWISVPDIDVWADLHIKFKDKLKPPQFPFNALIHGGQEYEGNTHYCSFNYPFLEYCLRQAGMGQVRRIPYKEHLENLPGVSDYSTCEYQGVLISLTVEAIKP